MVTKPASANGPHPTSLSRKPGTVCPVSFSIGIPLYMRQVLSRAFCSAPSVAAVAISFDEGPRYERPARLALSTVVKIPEKPESKTPVAAHSVFVEEG